MQKAVHPGDAFYRTGVTACGAAVLSSPARMTNSREVSLCLFVGGTARVQCEELYARSTSVASTHNVLEAARRGVHLCSADDIDELGLHRLQQSAQNRRQLREGRDERGGGDHHGRGAIKGIHGDLGLDGERGVSRRVSFSSTDL